MGEVTLQGASAAPGVAFGAALVLAKDADVDLKVVRPEERRAELELALRALQSSAAELETIASTMRRIGRSEEADIVETGILMANDPGLIARVEALVIGSGRPAAAALREAADRSADELAQLADPLLAERADDVRSLGRRAAQASMGATSGVPNGVLIAESLGPADVAELGLGARGVALAGGGVTAHAAIVARSLGIPMVVGLGPDIFDIRSGEEVVLDGDGGLLIRRPGAIRVEAANAKSERRRVARLAAVAQRLEPAETTDGRRIVVLANAASMAEAIEAMEQGAEGIGLLRSELTFLDAAGWPSFAKQVAFLNLILARIAGRTATVRLLDFGGDKTPPFLRGTDLRGIELLLEAPDALTTQLAAIVEAGRNVKLRILVPMVSSVEQVRSVRAALAAVLEGSPSPELGAMIETPEAARNASAIATEVDFLSLGTNDLTQLVLGLNREQSKSAPVSDVRVLTLIDATMRAGREAGIPVDVCGEAASDERTRPIMVGLGADELSVAAARVGEVREHIRTLTFARCQELAAEALLGQVGHAGRERV
ncbi:MAG: multiphosphoryl transfer protein [Chloroflexota bacterium]|nr:multiphosphoryl transfer protein [Chloroflexota bacterium]